MAHFGLQLVVLDPGAAFDAEQRGHGGAIDIGIEQANRLPGAGEREGQVGGHGGFANAALAAGHRNQLADARHGAGLRCGRGRRGSVGGENDARDAHTGHALHGGFNGGLQALGRGLVEAVHRQHQAHGAIVLHHDASGAAGFHHGAAAGRISHRGQRGHHIVLHGHQPVLPCSRGHNRRQMPPQCRMVSQSPFGVRI